MPGTLVRMRPFMGQLGTCPSMAMPDSHNAGDFGAFLVGAPHDYAITAEQLAEHKTDGHMDIDAVRAGAILVARSRCRARASTWATCTQARATARSRVTRWMSRAA
jgi:formamidase